MTSVRLGLDLPGGAATVESAWCYAYAATPGQPLTAMRLPRAHMLSSEELGLQPSVELLLALLRDAGVVLPAHARTPGTTAAAFIRETDRYVVVVNANPAPTAATLVLQAAARPAGRTQVRDMLSGTAWEVDSAATGSHTVPLGSKAGTVLHLRPA